MGRRRHKDGVVVYCGAQAGGTRWKVWGVSRSVQPLTRLACRMKNRSRRDAMRSTRAAAQDGTLGDGTGMNLERNSDLPGGGERVG